MEKTKFGLSVAIMGAIVYLTALFGGYTPLLLVAGYILLIEDNADLKRTSVSAFGILLVFSALNLVIGLLPDILSVFYSLLRIFNVHVYLSFIDNIATFLYNVLGLLKEVVLVVLAVLSAVGKPLKLSFIDKYFI